MLFIYDRKSYNKYLILSKNFKYFNGILLESKLIRLNSWIDNSLSYCLKLFKEQI